jgi:hypothetical protein
LTDYLDGCLLHFAQVTQIQVALKDSSSTTAKCNEIDVMTKESIRLFNDSLSPEAERLGEKEIDATKNEYFRRVNAIAFRAKQQFIGSSLSRTRRRRRIESSRVDAWKQYSTC